MTFGFLVDIEFVWGFQARVAGLSRTSPSFYYPPPTSFLGALAESLAKKYNIGEDEGRKIILNISQNLLAIGIRPINCIPIKYEDISRIITVRILSGKLCPDPKNLKSSFDSPARGKTVMSSYNDEAPKIRVFIVLRNNEISLRDKKVRISVEDFWRIHRIGSKESIVSVSSVELVSVEQKSNFAITKYSFPLLDGINPKNEEGTSWKDEVYLSPFMKSEYSPAKEYLTGKNTLTFKVPIKVSLSDPAYSVEYNKKFSAYSYKNGEEVVIGWSE